MRTLNKPGISRLALLGALVFAYFVLYPQDLEGLLAPVKSVLDLSNRATPWLYALASVTLVCWTAIRILRKHSHGGST